MRLPTESQLSQEQKQVCFADSNQSILVSGPPGSGKTVVAVFRQESLKKLGENVRTVVFTNVLKRYTDIDATFHSWLESWWRRCTNTRFPTSVVNGPPMWNFETAQQLVMEEYEQQFRSNGNWGHLILDEAQDFAKSAHRLLYLVQNRVFGDLETGERPNITVLADENQRLTDTSSTIKEIKTAYLMHGEQLYTLKKNYRNTLEIAALAAHFYVGLQTGIPEPPTTRGDRPELKETKDLNEAVKKIEKYVLLHANEEVGVLVYRKGLVKKLFNQLHHKLSGKGVTVQAFVSGDKKLGDATRIVFDQPGHVTILCFASAKGLEFDAVFLPELQTFTAVARGTVEAKMQLYVMISRARKRLFLMITDPQRREESIRGLLPPPTSNLLQFE